MRTVVLLVLLNIQRTASRHRASLKVEPSRSQFFEYEPVTLSCEDFRSGEWKVWRYTLKGFNASFCGDGWGNQTGNKCEMKTVKGRDSGVYWCQSREGDSSNAVVITVTEDKPVILESPVAPVKEGDQVTLRCRNSRGNVQASFFKNGSRSGREDASHLTIHNVSKSDEGEYRCCESSSKCSEVSWLLVDDDSSPASLSLNPNWSHFFEYEKLLLRCNQSGWMVRRFTKQQEDCRKTSEGKRRENEGSKKYPNLCVSTCELDKWGKQTAEGCNFKTAKQSDGGVYWCESATRQRSNSINITIFADDQMVILQSPVLPVMEGENVTLLCKVRGHDDTLPASFFKHGSPVRNESTGRMAIHNVTKADEGPYTCYVSGKGQSPINWLFVRAEGEEDGHKAASLSDSHLSLLRYILVSTPYVSATIVLLKKTLRPHRPTDRNVPVVSMAALQRSEEEHGLDPEYENDVADAAAVAITTVHHF